MSEIPLRRWLQKQPQPSFVVADMPDGTEKKVRIGVSRSRYRDAEEALEGAVACEALDDEGAVLRTWDSGKKKDTSLAPVAAAQSQENLLLVQLANVLASVADRSVERYQGIVKMSFDQNEKLLKLISDRLTAIEKLYQQSLIAQAEALAAEQEAAAEAAENANDPNLPLVAQVLTQALGGNGANGASKETE